MPPVAATVTVNSTTDVSDGDTSSIAALIATPGADGAEQLLAVVPVPVNDTVCGLPDEESVTVMVPLRVPVCVGAKTTLIVQLAPPLRLAGQLLL